MSINGINRPQYVNPYNSSRNKAIGKVDKTKEVDRIEISDIGKSLKSYSSREVVGNAQKVADIKNKISSGTYKVDARLTAQSLLNAMKESNA
ncbi:flagellar biosynthesis anti-sigma factor FlgM [Clostridium sp. C2-6-12]|uniref:flagellar biosynthesis anti-sigma factor FlgM n=1 Tax=Clostridium sp. C2-6-12 TaxID=2698832 RepID=UPI00136A414A|nr:flagellar biosynthesis anti-sigma factor FlgM [Clostridium sp. C2-6-12]